MFRITLLGSAYAILSVFLQKIQWSCEADNAAARKTNAVHEVRQRASSSWPNGVINYYFDRDSYDNLLAQGLRMAMNEIEAASCIKFTPLMVKPENNSAIWIHFTNKDKTRECYHDVPAQNVDTGEAVIALGLDCLKRPQLMHTLLHAMGFPDEVQHPNRDQYVRIHWQNISPQHRSKFGLFNTNVTLPWDYDSRSIMHFHDHAFTKNGRPTSSLIFPGSTSGIAPSDHLSQQDKMKLRISFEHECNKRKVKSIFEGCKRRLAAAAAGGSDSGKDDKVHKDTKDDSKPNGEIIVGDTLDNDSEPNEGMILGSILDNDDKNELGGNELSDVTVGDSNDKNNNGYKGNKPKSKCVFLGYCNDGCNGYN